MAYFCGILYFDKMDYLAVYTMIFTVITNNQYMCHFDGNDSDEWSVHHFISIYERLHITHHLNCTGYAVSYIGSVTFTDTVNSHVKKEKLFRTQHLAGGYEHDNPLWMSIVLLLLQSQ